MVQVTNHTTRETRTFPNLAAAIEWLRPYQAKKTDRVSAGLPPALRRRLEQAKTKSRVSMAEVVRRGIVTVLR